MTIQHKVIKVSSQRHLVIPKQFYDALHIQDEVIVELHEGQLVIKPVIKVEETFAENLLEQLVAAGYTGEQLIATFKEMKQRALNGEQLTIEPLQ